MPVYTRDAFYDLLWSAPASKIAVDLGISDVALGKAAKRHGIPTPERGYWAKLSAGKKVSKAKLPPRRLGQTNTITVGGSEGSGAGCVDQADSGIPPLPGPLRAHEESLTDLLTRLKLEVGTVTVPKSLSAPHGAVAKLLEIDAARIEKLSNAAYPWSGDQPYYASPYEKRRLRLLSAMFKSLAKLGLEVQAKGKDANEFRVFVREGSSVTFRLDHPLKADSRSGYFATSKPDRPASDALKLHILWWSRAEAPFRCEWEDSKTTQIEEYASEIAVTLAFAVEATYRQWEIDAHQRAIDVHEYAIQQREELRLAEIRAREAADAALHQARLNKLLADATAFRLAQDIRSYAEAVVEANKQSCPPVPDEEIAAWQMAAMQCADDVDPVLSRQFLKPAVVGTSDVVGATHPAHSPSSTPAARLDGPWHPNQFSHFHGKR